MEIKKIIAVALSGSLLLGGSLTLAKDQEGVNDPTRETAPPSDQGIQQYQNKTGVQKKAIKTKKAKKSKKAKKGKKKSAKKAAPAEPASETPSPTPAIPPQR